MCDESSLNLLHQWAALESLLHAYVLSSCVILTEQSEWRDPEVRRSDAEDEIQKSVLHILVLPVLQDYGWGPGSLDKLEMTHLRCVYRYRVAPKV